MRQRVSEPWVGCVYSDVFPNSTQRGMHRLMLAVGKQQNEAVCTVLLQVKLRVLVMSHHTRSPPPQQLQTIPAMSGASTTSRIPEISGKFTPQAADTHRQNFLSDRDSLISVPLGAWLRPVALVSH